MYLYDEPLFQASHPMFFPAARRPLSARGYIHDDPWRRQAMYEQARREEMEREALQERLYCEQLKRAKIEKAEAAEREARQLARQLQRKQKLLAMHTAARALQAAFRGHRARVAFGNLIESGRLELTKIKSDFDELLLRRGMGVFAECTTVEQLKKECLILCESVMSLLLKVDTAKFGKFVRAQRKALVKEMNLTIDQAEAEAARLSDLINRSTSPSTQTKNTSMETEDANWQEEASEEPGVSRMQVEVGRGNSAQSDWLDEAALLLPPVPTVVEHESFSITEEESPRVFSDSETVETSTEEQTYNRASMHKEQ